MNSFTLASRVLRVDKRTRVSAILTAVGVAVATALVLLLVALPFATQARSERSSWQLPSASQGEPTLQLAQSDDYYDGKQITRVDVAALTDPSSIELPPGVDRLPQPGETLLSPGLAELAGDAPGSQLGDRFGESVGVLGESALEYPDQLVALVGNDSARMPENYTTEQHGFAIGEGQSDGMLELLAMVGVIVLFVPCLVLVGSAARLTAARRERRLAALRLAGATPSQVVGMVAAETTLAAIGGAIIGFAVSPALRSLAALVPWEGGTWQPSDFTLPLGVSLPITVAIPVFVLLAAVLGLRRVMRTPLGATGGHSRKPLHWWRLLPLPLSGLVFFFGVSSDSGGGELPVFGGLALLVASIALAGPWVTSMVGGIFVRAWRGPSSLLAGRRLRDDPRGAYRASAGVVLAVFTGSMALTLFPTLESMAGASTPYRDSALYVETSAKDAQRVVDETNRALEKYGQGEQAVTSQSVMLRNGRGSVQSAMVLDCASAGKLLQVDTNGACAGEPAIYSPYELTSSGGLKVEVPGENPKPVALPAGAPVRPITAKNHDGDITPIIDPALLPANFASDYTTVAVPTTEADHEIVRTALAGAAGASPIESREARLADQQSQLDDILRVTVIGLIAATVLSGCGAAIATAGALMDRRRTYGALIAAGTEVNVLAKALRTEAALPALVATIGAGVVGTLVGAGLYNLVGDAPIVLTPWLCAPVVLGVGAAVLASSVCKPMLKRVQSEPLADE